MCERGGEGREDGGWEWGRVGFLGVGELGICLI